MRYIALRSRNIYQDKTYGSHDQQSDLNCKPTYINWLFCGHHCGYCGINYWFRGCDWIHLKAQVIQVFYYETYYPGQNI